MDGDERVAQGLLQRALDPVADFMGIRDAHLRRDHEVEVDEGHPPRGPGPHVMGFERAVGLLRDDIADLRQLLLGGGLVHEPAERVPDHPPAGPEDVEGHEGRHRRVEDLPAGEHHQQDPHRDPDRGHDIRQQVLAIRRQRRGAQPAPLPDEHPGPAGVERAGKAAQQQAEDRRVDRPRRRRGMPGLAQDHHRRNDDQDAAQDGAEIFHLAVAIGVVRIRRLRRDPHRDQRRDRRRDIHEALQGVRIKRHRSGYREGEILDPEDHEFDQNASGRDPDRVVHRFPAVPPVQGSRL